MRLFKIIVLLALSAAGYLWWTEKNAPIGVNLHGVNYTAETFSFYLTDPAQPDSISGGSGLIDPFGGGGISCCAVLPRKWQPGLKLTIHAKHYLKEEASGRIPEVKEVVHVDVPKYVDGKPGEIWVLRTAAGKVEVVSSNVEPDHPQWPGTVKGWPVPSIAYRRERWEVYRKIEASNVAIFSRALEELEVSPLIRAQEDWNSTKKFAPNDLKGFSGPDDPLYIAELKASYAKVLAMSKKDLQRIMESKP